MLLSELVSRHESFCEGLEVAHHDPEFQLIRLCKFYVDAKKMEIMLEGYFFICLVRGSMYRARALFIRRSKCWAQAQDTLATKLKDYITHELTKKSLTYVSMPSQEKCLSCSMFTEPFNNAKSHFAHCRNLPPYASPGCPGYRLFRFGDAVPT